MTAAEKTALVVPRLEAMQDLLRAQPPCLSVMLPPYRPGGQAKSPADLLRTVLREAGRQLEAQNVAADLAVSVLDPLQQLVASQEMQAGSHWSRILYRAPDRMQQFLHIHSFEQPVLVTGRHFHIRPILNTLHLPVTAYVLKLTQKRVELLRVAPFYCERVPLPNVPETLEEALALNLPDQNLMNRKKTGGHSTGTMGGVLFSTDEFRESMPTYIADFYKMVDRDIAQMLNNSGAPLILAGVAEDTVLYRQAASYRHLLEETIPGSPTGGPPSWKSEDELIRLTDRILRNDLNRRSVATLQQAYEKLRPARMLHNIELVLQAAADGRVHQLFLNASRRFGENGEDLLNRAAVETLRRGGAAYELSAEDMPDHALADAVLRY